MPLPSLRVELGAYIHDMPPMSLNSILLFDKLGVV